MTWRAQLYGVGMFCVGWGGAQWRASHVWIKSPAWLNIAVGAACLIGALVLEVRHERRWIEGGGRR